MSVMVEGRMGNLKDEINTLFPLFQKTSGKHVDLQARSTEANSHLAAFGNETSTNSGAKKMRVSQISNGSTRLKRYEQTETSTAAIEEDQTELKKNHVDLNNGRRKRQKTADENSDGCTPSDEGRSVTEVELSPGLLNMTLSVAREQDMSTGSKAYKSPHTVLTDRASFTIGPARNNMRTTAVYNKSYEDALQRLADVENPQPVDASKPVLCEKKKFTVLSTTTAVMKAKPKKILQFNPKSGTIGSPPFKKQAAAADKISKKFRRNGKAPKSMLVKIFYNSRIGPEIEQILSSSRSIASTSTRAHSALAKEEKICPAKPLHPLFMGNSTKILQEAKSDLKKVDVTSLTNPRNCISLRKAILGPSIGGPSSRDMSPPPWSDPSLPQKYSSPPTFLGFGKSMKLPKFPGAMEPAWPWECMVHIRGVDADEKVERDIFGFPIVPSPGKKSKETAIDVCQDEDVITLLANDLSIRQVKESIRHINLDEFPSVPQCLRVPKKYYESGLDVQNRIRKHLRTRLPLPEETSQSSSEDEIQGPGVRPEGMIHPALKKVHQSIATSLSAFDMGYCESQVWTQKYAPNKAEEVLQVGREALILREWLFNLTVNSVEIGRTGSKQSSSSKLDPVGKKKRKSAKLDGFVVSSDEEYDLEEVTDPEDNASLGHFKRTVVRGGEGSNKALKDASKVAHTVLVSGPHGCGKTAAVYATAKELGFEVFEINPSSRRSGRDIMEKVGDMTQNHHVQHIAGALQLGDADDDRKMADATLVNELETGRQGTMNSFFKLKAAKSKVPRQTPAVKSASIIPSKKHATFANNLQDGKVTTSSRPAKEQKQSLILIEEADIIYKEDSQFWATIENIIAISRRPIVVTCNDESIIPLAFDSLHAILRFQPPPLDLAVDYLLMIAACEGHVVQREAVRTLHNERGMDLRASITTLNFWCQFAVGDVNRGLSWYYPRQRGRQDVDECGHTIRVISEGTYEKGMGFLSQDILESNLHYLDVEEEVLHQTSEIWGLDLGNWEDTIDMRTWANKIQEICQRSEDKIAVLDMFAVYTESLSDSDLYSGALFGSANQVRLDASVPRMKEKAWDDYPVAHRVMETPLLPSYTNISRSLSLYTRSRARDYLQVSQHLKYNFDIRHELSTPTESHIVELICRNALAPIELKSLRRLDFSRAFDPISFPPSQNTWTVNSSMEASQFDRTQRIITEDLAPYVRGIVAHDARLQRDRQKMCGLLSEGCSLVGGKRRRMTRAAISALEGGTRSETKRDRYFGNSINPVLVGRTGLRSWTEAVNLLERDTEAGGSLGTAK